MTALMRAHKVLLSGRTCERCGYWAQSVECRRLAETGEECARPTWAAPTGPAGWGPPDPAGWHAAVKASEELAARVDVQRSAPVVRRARVSKAKACQPEVTVDPLKPVYVKRTKRNGHNVPIAKFALYRPPVEPTWPTPWTLEELAAMGQLSERSEAWKKWYAAMPAGMTAKQERAYFLKGGGS